MGDDAVFAAQQRRVTEQLGAAMLAAVGSGLFPDLTQAASHVKVNGRYTPNTALKPVYDRNYRVFRQLYASNKKNFALLNRLKEG